MINPLSYETKTQETMLLGITHYDYLLEWCIEPKRAYHLLDVFINRDAELEKIVSKSSKYAYWYARYVLEDRFLLGEEAIGKDTEYAYYYVMDIIQGRFVPYEDTLSNNAIYSYYYARYVLEDRFLLGEEAISKSAEYAYLYAYEVLKSPFVLGEKAIMNSQYKDHYLSFINQ